MRLVIYYMKSVIYFMRSVINFILWGRSQIYGVGYLCYEVGPKSRGIFLFLRKNIYEITDRQ